MEKIKPQHEEIKRIKSELELEGTVWRDPETNKTFLIQLCKDVELEIPFVLDIDDANELELLNYAFLVQADRYFGDRRKSVKSAIGIARSKVEQRIVWDVYRRDGFKCFYCECDFGALTFDHYIPESLGGPTNIENGRAACKWCNHRKANRLPDEWERSDTLKERKEHIAKMKEKNATKRA